MSMIVAVPPLHAAQLEVAQDPHRFRVLVAGRRFGKSRLAAILCILEGLAGRRAWWCSPSYPMAGAAWRELKDLAAQAGAEIRESDMTVVFPRGGFVRVRSSDKPGSLRGEGLDFVVMDEAAFQDENVWVSELRPSLADRLGRALLVSTPNGHDWFWRLFTRGQNPHESEWKSWQFPTARNPFIEPEEISQAESDMPSRRFATEFLAIPGDNAGSVFRDVRRCATSSVLERGVPGRSYSFGVDWGRSDFTATAVFDTGSGAMVSLQASNMLQYTIQRGRLLALYEKFHPAVVLCEENSIGEVNREELERDGIPVTPFVMSNASKTMLVDELNLAIERQSIALLDDPALLSELENYTMTRLPSGVWRYEAAGSGHDDRVVATMLGWHACTGGAPMKMSDVSYGTGDTASGFGDDRPGWGNAASGFGDDRPGWGNAAGLPKRRMPWD